MASFSDNFDRSNGALGANWTDRGGEAITIVSNKAFTTSGWNYGFATVEAAGCTALTDCEASVVAGTTDTGVCIRAGTTTANLYFLMVTPAGAWNLVRVSGGAHLSLGSGSGRSINGKTYTARGVGTTISAYENTTQLSSGTNTAHASGRGGLWTSGGLNVDATWENFVLTDLAVTATGNPIYNRLNQ